MLTSYSSGNLGYLGIAFDIKTARGLQLTSAVEVVKGLDYVPLLQVGYMLHLQKHLPTARPRKRVRHETGLQMAPAVRLFNYT